MHSNGLCFPNLAGPAGPRAGEGRWALAERREAGANRGPLGPGVRGPAGCAPGPRRRPDGAIRYLPLQPLSALALPKPTVGSQAFGASSERPSLGLLEGQPRPSVPGPPCAPQGLWAVGGGVDRAVLDAQRDGRLQVALSDPEQGSFACAWRDFVSACLCPVCVCAEAPATPRVCTFSVRPENRLETCPGGLA